MFPTFHPSDPFLHPNSFLSIHHYHGPIAGFGYILFGHVLNFGPAIHVIQRPITPSYSFYLDIFMDFAIYCLGISKILGCYTCPNNDLNFGNNNVLNFGPLIHLIYLTIHLSISLLLSRLILGFCYSLFGHIYVGFGLFSTPHFFSLIYREFVIMSLT